MTITLLDGSSTLELSPDLYWADENSWQPVEQAIQRTITGGLVISSARRVGGRPITLKPEDDRSAWMTRSTLDALRLLAAIPDKMLTLTLRGVNHQVIFRHHDGAAIEAEPIVHYSDVVGDDWYSITLRFMEV